MYHGSIGWFGGKATGYSADVLKMNYHELIGYLTNPLNDTLKMTDFPSSEQGLFHFFEMQNVFSSCEFCCTARIRAYQFWSEIFK